MAETAPEILDGIFDDFSRLNDLNAFMEGHYYNGAKEYERDELVSAIGARLIGHILAIDELPSAKSKDENPVLRWRWTDEKKLEDIARSAGVPKRETYAHPKTGKTYAWDEYSGFRSRSRGKVEAVDGPRCGLVVKPRGLDGWVGDKDWVRVANTEGEPLVAIRLVR